ncbi:hypothetical protein C6382_07470 [Pseudomonas sp. BBP2017]|nr:hypothetical protein C6382_07470 [Pseudomonas sp. BBP2017]
MDLIDWAQKGPRPRADMVMEIKAVCQGMLRSTVGACVAFRFLSQSATTGRTPKIKGYRRTGR